MWFTAAITFLILQRLAELLVAKRNEKWLLSHGAVEYGAGHYPWMVALHTAFILSLVTEYLLKGAALPNYFLLILYLLILVLKVIVLSSLGKYWNTKIYRISGAAPVRQGIYKYLRHPNYIIVILEIAIIPLIFQLYITAVAFTILNALMLSVRIKEENKAWEQ